MSVFLFREMRKKNIRKVAYQLIFIQINTKDEVNKTIGKVGMALLVDYSYLFGGKKNNISRCLYMILYEQLIIKGSN